MAQGMPVGFTDPFGVCQCEVINADLNFLPCSVWRNPGGTVRYGAIIANRFEFGGDCECCGYRQYVASGGWLRVLSVDGPIEIHRVDQGEMREDCRDGRCYGHRSNPNEDGDRYSNDGCAYSMGDTPGWRLGIALGQVRRWPITGAVQVELAYFATFVFQVIDTCRDNKIIFMKVQDVDCPPKVFTFSADNSLVDPVPDDIPILPIGF